MLGGHTQGIVLEQHIFMDRMMVETIPRSILLKRGGRRREEDAQSCFEDRSAWLGKGQHGIGVM